MTDNKDMSVCCPENYAGHECHCECEKELAAAQKENERLSSRVKELKKLLQLALTGNVTPASFQEIVMACEDGSAMQ